LAATPNGPGFIGAITYFSLSALTPTGFGDIVPMHPFARSLANLEAIIGQLYPATLLARIVTPELAHRRARGRRSDG
jgi:ion channel